MTLELAFWILWLIGAVLGGYTWDRTARGLGWLLPLLLLALLAWAQWGAPIHGGR